MKSLYHATALTLKYLPPTNTLGARVRITCPHLKASKVVDWPDVDDGPWWHTTWSTVVAIAHNALKLGVEPIAYYTLSDDTYGVVYPRDTWDAMSTYFGRA